MANVTYKVSLTAKEVGDALAKLALGKMKETLPFGDYKSLAKFKTGITGQLSEVTVEIWKADA